MDLALGLLDAFDLVVVLVMFFFAARLVFTFRGGKHQRPWTLLAGGSGCIATATLVFALSTALGGAAASDLVDAGALIDSIAGILFTIAFVDQYRIWSRRE
ncbi:MAG: hypothetical protein JRN27_07955 [Nitrososphaerota archaeon]|nr:hypothetical protein [Nitrososphaerota archaeon]